MFGTGEGVLMNNVFCIYRRINSLDRKKDFAVLIAALQPEW